MLVFCSVVCFFKKSFTLGLYEELLNFFKMFFSSSTAERAGVSDARRAWGRGVVVFFGVVTVA